MTHDAPVKKGRSFDRIALPSMNVRAMLVAAGVAVIAAALAIASLVGGTPYSPVQDAAASFVANTRVLTPDGPATIASLRAGQAVVSYDPVSGEVANASVLEITSRSHGGEIISIVAGGQTVRGNCGPGYCGLGNLGLPRCGALCFWLSHPCVLAGLAATAIAAPIIINNTKSPSSP